MSGLNQTELERRLASAAQSAAPDLADEIWEAPVEAAAGDEWYLKQPARRSGSRPQTIYIISAVAALLALVIITRSVRMSRPCAMIYLDVNPSIHLEIDRRDRIVSAAADNADGETVLEGMDLTHTDLDVAINAIFGSMVRCGYLSQDQNVVLLSVDSSDAGKTETLRAEISREIDTCLAALLSNATVLDQSVHADESLESLSELYGITPGKAALILHLVDANPELKFEDLVGLKMGDLVQQLLALGIDLEAYAGITGTIPAVTAPAEASPAVSDDMEDTLETASPSPTDTVLPSPAATPSASTPHPVPEYDDDDHDEYDEYDEYDDNDDYDDYDDSVDDYDDYDDGVDDYDDDDIGGDVADDEDGDDTPVWTAPPEPVPESTAPPVNYDDDDAYDDADDYDDDAYDDADDYDDDAYDDADDDDD